MSETMWAVTVEADAPLKIGQVGKPSGGELKGVDALAELAGLIAGGMCLGKGGLARCPPGQSIVPSKICNR